MRYPVSEKLEIIRLVEQSHLPTRRTIDRLMTLFQDNELNRLSAGVAAQNPSYAPSKAQPGVIKVTPPRRRSIHK